MTRLFLECTPQRYKKQLEKKYDVYILPSIPKSKEAWQPYADSFVIIDEGPGIFYLLDKRRPTVRLSFKTSPKVMRQPLNIFEVKSDGAAFSVAISSEQNTRRDFIYKSMSFFRDRMQSDYGYLQITNKEFIINISYHTGYHPEMGSYRFSKGIDIATLCMMVNKQIYINQNSPSSIIHTTRAFSPDIVEDTQEEDRFTKSHLFK